MITDDERRATAAKLRRLQSRQFRDEDKPEIVTWEGIGAAVLPDDEWQRIDRFRSRDNRTQAVRSVIAGRLADLIEPSCDRDALLALAEEMEEFGKLPIKNPGIRVLQNDDFSRDLGYARRIREALGVES